MAVDAPFPVECWTAVVARKARRIKDPVERLRFLQKEARKSSMENMAVPATIRPDRRMWRFALLCVPAPLLLCLIPRIVVHPGEYRSGFVVPDHAISLGKRTAPLPGPNVWLLEAAKEYDVYSNGLRIENAYSVTNRRRRYAAFARGQDAPAQWRTEPAGIVFHTTESLQAPFNPDHSRTLTNIGRYLVEFVCQKRAYHFVIDRFGRVYRAVIENDTANHAGNSSWADDKWSYINLNSSFLAIAFEAQTQHSDESPTINEAQIHSGRTLTDMLRSRYDIPTGNCITHAQVSLNPTNKRIGYHTDWAGNFPFREMGLPDNYSEPVPSMYLFGFEYDDVFSKVAGSAIGKGLESARALVQRQAAVRGLSVSAYRSKLQKKYWDQAAALRKMGAQQENTDDSN